MHSTIAVPADVNAYALERALATIGLVATRTGRGLLIFDHGKLPASLCEQPGCGRPALVTDAAATLCAKHWLALRVPA